MMNYLNMIGFHTYTEIQEKILKISKNKNVLAIAPCGSGKTEGSYQWEMNNDKKSIYVLPRVTLATSQQDRLNIYNRMINKNKWTLQHSLIQEDKFLSNEYCITTIDQVLAGWLGIGTQSFIKGKNIVDSNLILDEVQLFDIDKNFLTTLCMLDSIYKEGKQNFMIMTATMPTYCIEFLKDRYDMEVIICKNESIKNRQVKIEYKNEINFNKINNENKKQIIICNTIKEQEYVKENIIDKKRIVILNNELLKTDRKHIEEQMFKYFDKSSEENNKILITTQMVEAGVDISANIVYSSISPIDNLIQRCGRCSRWGGDGSFIVFNSESSFMYDKDVILKTISELNTIKNDIFSWEQQLKSIDNVLNDYYKKHINNKTLKLHKINIRNNKRKELIRDIQAVNIIVSNNIRITDINKESVSISLNKLDKISKYNELYVLKKGELIRTSFEDVENGDTIIIKGINCTYDDLGFRFKENYICDDFPYIEESKQQKIAYTNYEDETLLNHSILVKGILSNKLKSYLNIDYIQNNYKHILNILALHDLGKSDLAWCEWSNSKSNILAHFPKSKTVFRHKNRKHNFISAYLLKNQCDKLLFNVIIQHHGRIFIKNNNLYIDTYELHTDTKYILKNFNIDNIYPKGNNIIISGNEILNPSDNDWNLFLRLEGLLMESDIEAIKCNLGLCA